MPIPKHSIHIAGKNTRFDLSTLNPKDKAVVRMEMHTNIPTLVPLVSIGAQAYRIEQKTHWNKRKARKNNARETATETASQSNRLQIWVILRNIFPTKNVREKSIVLCTFRLFITSYPCLQFSGLVFFIIWSEFSVYYSKSCVFSFFGRYFIEFDSIPIFIHLILIFLSLFSLSLSSHSLCHHFRSVYNKI